MVAKYRIPCWYSPRTVRNGADPMFAVGSPSACGQSEAPVRHSSFQQQVLQPARPISAWLAINQCRFAQCALSLPRGIVHNFCRHYYLLLCTTIGEVSSIAEAGAAATVVTVGERRRASRQRLAAGRQTAARSLLPPVRRGPKSRPNRQGEGNLPGYLLQYASRPEGPGGRQTAASRVAQAPYLPCIPKL